MVSYVAKKTWRTGMCKEALGELSERSELEVAYG